MPVFTDTFVKAAKARGNARLEITDTRTPGLVLRVTPGGVKSFMFQYRSPFDGKVKRLTIGRYPEITLAGARGIAGGCRTDIEQGVEPSIGKVARTGAMTFALVASRYLEGYAKVRKASWKNDEGYLRRPLKVWGHRDIRSITDNDASELLEAIASSYPTTANRTQAVLHKLFAWAKEPGRKWVKVNPLADMPRKGLERPKERVLTDDEIVGLWTGMDARPVAQALRLILLTMARPGEVAGARRSEIQGAEWHLPVERVKNRRPFVVPLSPMALALMAGDGEAVFPSRLNSRESIARHSLAQALANVTFSPHDLRRTAATIARRAGARRDAVEAMLNHTRSDVTAVYDKYDMLAEKREVAEILEAEIKRLLNKKINAPGTRR